MAAVAIQHSRFLLFLCVCAIALFQYRVTPATPYLSVYPSVLFLGLPTALVSEHPSYRRRRFDVCAIAPFSFRVARLTQTSLFTRLSCLLLFIGVPTALADEQRVNPRWRNPLFLSLVCICNCTFPVSCYPSLTYLFTVNPFVICVYFYL